ALILRKEIFSHPMSHFPAPHRDDFFRSLPAVVFELVVRREGPCFRFVSERSSAILGVSSKDLMDDSRVLCRVVPDHESHLLTPLFSGASADGEQVLLFHVDASEGPRPLELRYRDSLEDGVIVRRGFIAERALATEQGCPDDGYEKLFEKLPLAVVVHYEGVVLFANREAHKLVGAQQKRQLIGMDVMRFVHPSSLSLVTERIRLLNAGESVPAIEEKFVRLDGRIIEVESTAFPFVYKGKSAIQVILRDITERKKK